MIRSWWTVAAAALLITAPARAEEDGGTESPFAHGAGNRALALGGAFTAIADDASATVWNPAGLALMPRKEFVASQASLYDIGISEQFASFGWPSWRWGAGAVSVRRIGITDIERRDDRNVLLSTFNNSDLEIGLGYARAFGPAWRVGGLAKLHRQSLAGYSDTGLGLDLGVHLHPGLALGSESGWARRWTAGLLLRNALQPTIRLDETDVPDPVSVRVGTAYHVPFLSSGKILAAVDVEKPRDRAADLHAGLEVTPHPLLAVRAGWNGDDLTAGAGVKWSQYRFDYLFEDNSLETVHRFGISLGLGPTVQEQRIAALAAEEAAFRARLDETFERRRLERVDVLLAQADSLLDTGRVDEVLEKLATVQALVPDDPRVNDLEARAFSVRASDVESRGVFADAAILWGRVLALAPEDAVAQAGLERCRAESDRRAERTALIRELFANALDAFTAGDLLTARARLSDILNLSPDDEEAKAMHARTETAIAARVETLLRQARTALGASRLEQAGDLLDDARALDPGSREIASLDTRLAKAEQDLQDAARSRELAVNRTQVPVTPAPAKAPVLSQKKRKEIADLYRRGMEAMEAERPDDALHYWELVWLADPDYQNVAEFLKREYLLRGLESFSAGGLDEAIRLWEKARDVDPDDEKTLGYLSRAREQRSRTREILGE